MAKTQSKDDRRSTKNRPGAGNGHSETEHTIAWLLAGHDSHRPNWTDDVVAEVNGAKGKSLFFCPALQLLERRGKAIERAINNHDTLNALNFQKRPLNTLIRAEPVTLDSVLQVHETLSAIASCGHDKAMKATTVERRGTKTCFILEEDDVIPSYFWLDPIEFQNFRDHFGVRRHQFAALMFPKNKHGYFFDKLRTKSNDVEYDYRVTPFTKERVVYTMMALYQAGKDRIEANGYAPPGPDTLFLGASTAGLGGYNKTKALAISYGNATRPMEDEDKQAIDERVKDFVASLPGKIKARKREKQDA